MHLEQVAALSLAKNEYQLVPPCLKLNHATAQQTPEARLIAAQSFTKGDRVRHKVTGKLGIFKKPTGFALRNGRVQKQH